jgi:hypothetical protein
MGAGGQDDMKCGKMILILVTLTVSAASQDAKTRIFVTDHDSWQESAHFTATENGAGGNYAGYIRRISVEQMKASAKPANK